VESLGDVGGAGSCAADCSAVKKASHGFRRISTDFETDLFLSALSFLIPPDPSNLPLFPVNILVVLLEVRNLTKVFPLGESIFGGGAKGEVRAVDDVSVDIQSGETLGLVGESGSGKSTLGRLVLRLIEPTSGSIRYDGRALLTADSAEMRRYRRDLQIIFQDPFGSLDPRMRVEDIVAEPLVIHERMGAALRRTRVSELLRAVGLDGSAMLRFPHEFSGGQRQRIGIARALALHPKFIVADEPVSALDVSVGAQIVNLLAQLQREFGLTYLFISHSMPVVRYLATRIAVMYAGKIVEIGSSEQVTERPAHPYTRSLLAATPQLEIGGA
jgi:ABC-type glutathione transport system ATPase component